MGHESHDGVFAARFGHEEVAYIKIWYNLNPLHPPSRWALPLGSRHSADHTWYEVWW